MRIGAIFSRSLILILGLDAFSYAANLHKTSTKVTVAEPSSCVKAMFLTTGSPDWKTINIQIKNQCSEAIDFQSSSITFKSKTELSTDYWGNFSPLSYPDTALHTSSQKQTDGNYLVTLNLHFPTQYSVTALPVGASFQMTYGTNHDDHIEGTANVYLQSNVITDRGTLQIINQSAQPANVAQSYAITHISLNDQPIQDLQVPWLSTAALTGLTPGSYKLSSEDINDSAGSAYQGSIVPTTVTVTKDATVTANLSYSIIKAPGQIKITMPPLPDNLSGYASNPMVTLTQLPGGQTSTAIAPWGASTIVKQLVNGATYQFSTPNIPFNRYNCAASFFQPKLVANLPANTTTATYQCSQIKQDDIGITIEGAPSEQASVTMTMKPIDNSTPISKTISLDNGSGSDTVSLTDGSIYSVEAEKISKFSASISLQPLTATPKGSVTVKYSSMGADQGRVIAYLPGWKTLPAAQELADAGYTHTIVAFGVFSSGTPTDPAGTIINSFDTVTKDYINQLHAANIKVLLSLGGASTSLPNTTVDFHQALKAANSEASFKVTFVNSLKKMITDFGFDGFDIDIEQGLIPAGTFANPAGDVGILADIINTMYADNNHLLISMAPQVANISATSGFNQTWGNYASLIMQTHESLAWVGIQLYNTGCAYGLDQICYDQMKTQSPNFSVAMASDLLESWPSQLKDGRKTGFQNYISYLKPSQVVLGYPAANATGSSDGLAAIPTATIKRALLCLQTTIQSPTACDTYIPPKAYGPIGGVFEWEITYDENNQFHFAKDLHDCAVNGSCD